MTSETSTRYGSRVLRHGRSRAERAYQARSRRVKLTLCRAKVLAPLTPSGTLVLTPWPPLARGSSPPVPLSHVGPHPLSPSRTWSSPPVPLSLRERGDDGSGFRS